MIGLGQTPRSASFFLLQRVGDCTVVAAERFHVIADGMSADAPVMAAVEGRRQAQMRGASLFPEFGFPRPVRFVAVAHRHPYLDADLLRIAAGLLGKPVQLRQYIEPAL